MARLVIEARAAAAQKRLKKVAAAVENIDPTLGDIGDQLVKNVVGRFFKKAGPTGRPWKRSKRSGRRGRTTLVDSGALRDSISAVVKDGQLQVGTNIWYAHFHQQGGQIDAAYRQRTGSSRGAGVSLRALSSGISAERLARAAARGAKRNAKPGKVRRVKLPRRPFLGVSKKDRADMTKIIKAALEEAAK